jgi:hypothetical protein
MKHDASPELPLRYCHVLILALRGLVTSFGAHIVATNLPPYAAIESLAS